MIERLIEASLRYRLVVSMGAALLVAAGFLAMGRLPIDAMPDITPIQVQILPRRRRWGRWKWSSSSPVPWRTP